MSPIAKPFSKLLYVCQEISIIVFFELPKSVKMHSEKPIIRVFTQICWFLNVVPNLRNIFLKLTLNKLNWIDLVVEISQAE